MQCVYLVNEDVDLGYHTNSVWTSKEKADEVCIMLNDKYVINWPLQCRHPFWVQEMRLDYSEVIEQFNKIED